METEARSCLSPPGLGPAAWTWPSGAHSSFQDSAPELWVAQPRRGTWALGVQSWRCWKCCGARWAWAWRVEASTRPEPTPRRWRGRPSIPVARLPGAKELVQIHSQVSMRGVGLGAARAWGWRGPGGGMSLGAVWPGCIRRPHAWWWLCLLQCGQKRAPRPCKAAWTTQRLQGQVAGCSLGGRGPQGWAGSGYGLLPAGALLALWAGP